ncbi:MAG: sulfurtransferase [Holophagae bacterium]|jgi:thiosulfate/3-mercaptopyruvate sulfurtransferase
MHVFDRSTRALTLIAVVAAAAACASSGRHPATPLPQAKAEVTSLPDSLVTTEWLADHLNDPDLVVLDCTVTVRQGEDGGLVIESGRAGYRVGHIPTAGFADLMGELADADSTSKYALPSPQAFADAMGRLGVGDDTRVVLYDASMSAWAARVWWMLRWVGFDRAAVLDGGLAAWKAEGRPLSTEPSDEPVRVLTPAPRPELVADRDEVLAAIGDESVRLIDAMPEEHFRGEMTMYARPGHIPTADNVPVTALLDDTGRYKSNNELAALFGADRSGRAITYCGGGIAASATAFAMTRLGFTDVAVYTASLQEWAADPANPMVTESR